MPTKTPTIAMALSAVVAFSLPLQAEGAADPAYVGTWASDLAQCKVPQERQEAPLLLSKDGYDQYETHCKFTSVNEADSEWKVKSECTIEGNAEPYEFSLIVSGDTLTVTDETGPRDLLKCR